MKVQAHLETKELTKGLGLHELIMSFTLSSVVNALKHGTIFSRERVVRSLKLFISWIEVSVLC